MSSSINSWKITDSKILHATPWIEIVEDTCDASGTTLKYTTLAE